MDPVKIPCPYAPDCAWTSLPLDFDKSLILVEQHIKFKHPEAAEQTSSVRYHVMYSENYLIDIFSGFR